jgi:hypothetical protein
MTFSEPNQILLFIPEIDMATMASEAATRVYLQMEPELLESRIEFLISRYRVSPTKTKANTIVRHMEALCGHPDIIETDTPYCAYQRTLKYWRMISDDKLTAVEM